MESFFDYPTLQAYWAQAETWIENHLLTWGTAAQIVVLAVLYPLSALAARPVRAGLDRIQARERIYGPLRAVLSPARLLVRPLAAVVLLWVAISVMVEAGWPQHLLQAAASLLTAWIVIRYASSVMRDPAWSHFVAVVAWTIAALNILGLLDDTIAILDRLAINLGEVRLSALLVVKALIALAILLWLAFLASRLLERRITASPNLTPSVQVLIAKLLKATLVIVAVLAALSAVGLDLSAFALFGGALGVGLGFGLQKVVSNLVSGVILLLDKSIKPGDVIAVAGTYGWVKSMGARYASVITRDGIEHLIPNEELITTRVENWSYTDQNVRLKIPIGISYSSDPRDAIRLCVEAAGEVHRVLCDPAPKCLLVGFGDSSVDLELRVWIADARNGVRNVQSEILLNVWDRFRAAGIEIPFPQRDVHLREPESLAAALRDGQSPGAD